MFYSSHELPIDATENIQREVPRIARKYFYTRSLRFHLWWLYNVSEKRERGFAADGDFQQAGIYVRHSKAGMVAPEWVMTSSTMKSAPC